MANSIVAVLLLVLLVGFTADGARALGEGTGGSSSAYTAQGGAVPTASVVDCLVGCVTLATDCATSCTNKPVGEAPECVLACTAADISCVRECGPAFGPAPPSKF